MLRVETRDGVRIVSLDRGARANALSEAMVEGLIEQAALCFSDSGIHTLLLASEGDFSTGFDLSGFDQASDGDLVLRMLRVEILLSAIWHAPIHTVCYAPGRTWGAGADLLVACDVRIVTPDASIRFPGAQFGVVLGTRRLAERVGRSEALRLAANGATCDAPAALRSGIASEVRPAGALEAIASECAAPRAAPPTVRALRAATRADHRDSDLAALARSVSEPGLRARITAYRDATRKAVQNPSRKES